MTAPLDQREAEVDALKARLVELLGPDEAPRYSWRDLLFHAQIVREGLAMDIADAGREAARRTADFLTLVPPHVEVASQRRQLRRCTCGRCSTCARRSAVARNLTEFGSEDRPSAAEVTRIRTARQAGAA